MSNADWKPEELKQLAQLFPNYTRTAPTGEVIPTLTRAEFVALSIRYGNSHFKTDAAPAPTGNAEQDRLRARYPTMAPGYIDPRKKK